MGFVEKLKRFGFSTKFYAGIVLIVISLIVGKINYVVFFLYRDDPVIFWPNIVIYLLSWIPLFIGCWWIGKEYTESVKRFVSYQFYRQALKKGSRKVYHKTRAFGGRVKKKLNHKRRQDI